MMKNVLATVLAALYSIVGLSTGNAELSYRFKNARTNEIVSRDVTTQLDATADLTTNGAIEKTLFAIELGKTLENGLNSFTTACIDNDDDTTTPGAPGAGNSVVTTNYSACLNTQAQALEANVLRLSDKLAALDPSLHDEQLYAVLDLFRKLAQNMREFQSYPDDDYSSPPSLGPMPSPIPLPPSAPGIPVSAPLPAPPAGARPPLGVTTGGAQDFAHVRKLINDGGVPSADNFYLKGFLNEFALTPALTNCASLLCVEPIYKIDLDKRKLYVQVAMGTNVVEDEFARNPLNLSLVIDVSGSMDANDATEKSRLEWAKDAAIRAIENLNHDDYVSVVIFSSTSEIIVPTVNTSSAAVKQSIIDKIAALTTQGSTNVYDGLESAYRLVSEAQARHPNTDERVILISDAGLNTGVTDLATMLAMVSNYAAENIGLTAIGVGENFNNEFVEGITRAMGGNYLFVHSGRDLFRFFQSFNFLVTPIAYQFKASLKFDNLKLTFANAYGLPDNTGDLINVQTLFFTSSGGGAMLLEYDINE